MFKKFALSAACIASVAAIAVIVIAANKPSRFRIERSLTIKAPAEKMFNILSDMHEWSKWSPFEKDPSMKRRFSGAEKGKGAAYAWDGNNEVGSGAMEIVDVTEPSKIVLNLHFLKPFKADNVAEFTMTPEGDGTRVTWAMMGENQFVGKVMQVFINVDEMVGKDFMKGLENLKKLCES